MPDYTIEHARVEVRNVAAAAERYARALETETRLHSERGLEKAAAIGRIVGTPDPLTERAHSATSAEKVVEQDKKYSAHLARCRLSVVERIRYEAEYEVARLNARLAIAAAATTAMGGV
jgi:hypothetical protein